MKESWSGETNLEHIVGDYHDYLSLFYNDSNEEKISLRAFFDATRSPGDRGDYKTFEKIMKRIG